jgi:antitoxin MazE
MRVKVQAWGNSLGLRIPKAYANELGVSAGSEMEVNVEAGALRAALAPSAQLDALLAQITDENRHGELDWGGSIGSETW